MNERMLKFINIDQQSPKKRETGERKEDFNEIYKEYVKEKAKAITPVPGGVGPMTIACLLKNTLECFKARLT